jgi:RNA polymerase sigma-70 factor (ECF subfamily)
MSANAEALFARHYQPLFRYLCRAAGQRDVAKDLAQDVFVRVSRTNIPAGSARDLQAWIFRIARNVVIDHHRQRARTPAAASLVRVAPLAATQDVTVAVNQAVATLPDLERDVFLLREVGGLSYDEIASACDLTPDAVRNRIHRARLKLRELLAAPIAAHRTHGMPPSGRRP